MLDTLILSRIQFAANISFHILFPTITIALGWFLAFFKVRFEQTGDAVWMRAYRFWVKIFALSFALGVVSGITMSFQFGTNWPGFMEKVGNIAGPLLGYEVLTAFILEATFLGIMLFGINKVPVRIHTLACFIVAIGTTLSAFWILSLNSWMQTPAGFEMRDGIAYPTDWLAIIFNPSFPYRLSHKLLASGLTASFLIAGISSYRLLRGDDKKAPKLTLKVALLVAAVLAPLQAFVGDLHGLNTFEHQPQKVAAMEGVWETTQGAPLLIFAIPDEVRVMVGLGMLMIAVAWFASFKLYRDKSLPKWLLRVLVGMSFSGWLATLAGWYGTESGRQPFIVSGVLRVEDATTTIAPENVGFSLIMYLSVYAFLLVAYLHTVFLMARKAVLIEEINEQEHKGKKRLSLETKEISHV